MVEASNTFISPRDASVSWTDDPKLLYTAADPDLVTEEYKKQLGASTIKQATVTVRSSRSRAAAEIKKCLIWNEMLKDPAKAKQAMT